MCLHSRDDDDASDDEGDVESSKVIENMLDWLSCHTNQISC